MCAKQIDLELSLKNMDEFFGEPAADPFDPDSRYVSGIQEIVGQLRLKPKELDNKSRLVVRLPKAAMTPDAQPTLKSALDRYCDAKVKENQQAIDELRLGSRRETISAIVIVAVLVALSMLLVMLIPPLQAASGAIAGFVGIAIWVIFWDPIYNYVYAWRPYLRDVRVFRNLRAGDLVVEAA